MSQENVELVVGLLPPADADFVPLFRDEDIWTALTESIAPFYHPDFETIVRGLPEGDRAYTGMDGLRAAWLDWTAPWATYRIDIDEAVDLGDRVLLLTHDFARREGTTEEIKIAAAPVWTFRDGKIACIEFYGTRDEALKALGLSEQDAHADS
jgi:ketosteroid isomerase-like protein